MSSSSPSSQNDRSRLVHYTELTVCKSDLYCLNILIVYDGQVDPTNTCDPTVQAKDDPTSETKGRIMRGGVGTGAKKSRKQQ